MKTLILVRHAKASHDPEWETDWERPITESGMERAKKVAERLKHKQILPGKIISSQAFRALNTAMIFAMNLDYPTAGIEINLNLYGNRARDILEMLKNQEDKFNSLMIFGHNPSISDLCNLLTGADGSDFSTSAAGCIKFQINSWKDLDEKSGKLKFIETGK
jgi:phosphohistidine phosphatase